jgi:glycosyltransferase involved in cell wall biosynthesis
MAGAPPMRILVLTRSYPAAGDLYQYPFVHRRVLAYAARGHEVAVFRPTESGEPAAHEFEGVTCQSGKAEALRSFIGRFAPDVIAAHGFTETMHAALAATGYPVPTCAWLHGSEIPGFFRAKALSIRDPERRRADLDAVGARCEFWRAFLASKPEGLKLVFVSNSAVALFREDMGERLRMRDYAVIPNPIDTDLFAYLPKAAEDRLRIFMLRPFDSWTYGNDLAVAAIGHLSRTPGFDDLLVTIVGDGPLFDETVAPLPRAANVRVERRFLTQAEIAERHRRHGIFLVPTRLDTHGVSRDEAMASGLVPVTNAVSAVPEFVDDSCAGLAAPEDAEGLADAIAGMIADPRLFLARSARAAERVRRQSGHEIVVAAELALLDEAARG